ncbi:adhesion G-protein coupled receptor G1 isoform X2 [Cyprinodon tularosa]|uniref:adhesion G-protein coupled receptor G1 isoform X2 n=1 Tax=Cyprinodon tularosa TaxID=77115 RepID=UPI0018E27EC9|nr:adhesion G-protein coupled receptor G1 isoform X2 [Cyprinodon tularosa]
MKGGMADRLKMGVFIIMLVSVASDEHDLFLEFCGKWRHNNSDLSLNISVSEGCSGITVSANESSLSVKGSVTAKCKRMEVIPLMKYPEEDLDFCLYWEPLLDQLTLEVEKERFILCPPSSPAEKCCTDLSQIGIALDSRYGIADARVRTDGVTDKTKSSYSFHGEITNCKKLCDQANQTYVKGSQNTQHPCAQKFVKEIKKAISDEKVSLKGTPTVSIPSTMKTKMKVENKVSVTFFKKNSLFQVGYEEVQLLNDVVEITVENEIIANLTEPISIDFHHNLLPWNYKRKCVSWDTLKDPLKVNWLVDGCMTKRKGAKHTVCECDHLTYFSVLVQMELKPVRHLLALSAISSVGCATSFISCVAVIIFFCRNRRRSKEQSITIHMGLAVSLAVLSLFFFFTGVLGNVEVESMCSWVGAMLHYALLSSLTWMGIEVFNTFWMVYMVFRPSPRPFVWLLIGFGLPAVPVAILSRVGNIYGVVEIVPADDISTPYRMCWMNMSDQKTILAASFTTMTMLVILVFSGVIMLFLVYREIRTRDEWKQSRVAFLSIWGLSCLFGTTWGLIFLNFSPLADFYNFLFCFLNSFQGFFLMVRFCMLDWIRRQASKSVLGSTSSGSVKQHMLQTTEKS